MPGRLGKGAIGLGQEAIKRHQCRIVLCSRAAATRKGDGRKQGKPCCSNGKAPDQTQVLVPAMQTRRRRAKVTIVWVKVWLDKPGAAFSTPMSKRGV